MKRKTITIRIDSEGMEITDIDNIMKWDSPEVIEELRKKKKWK